jgi:hypothetical protein
MIATECPDTTRDAPGQSHENCRWAEPLIAIPGPSWLARSAFAWTCVREGRPRMLDTTDVCRRCADWTPVLRPRLQDEGRQPRSTVGGPR